MLEFKNVCSGYGKKQVLDNVSISFKKGNFTSIIGPNGCGKSTLLKTAMGMLPATRGKVFVENRDVAQMIPKEIARKVSYLPQGKRVPDMTVGQMVLHGRFAHLNYPRRYRQIDKEFAHDAMKKMNVQHLADNPLRTLSGGMRQNVYIATALAQDTPFVLMDEPTTYLDIGNRLALMETLKALANEGKGVVAVLHDITLALEFSDNVAVMESGRVVLVDTAENIYNSKVINRIFGVELKRSERGNGFSYYCVRREVRG